MYIPLYLNNVKSQFGMWKREQYIDIAWLYGELDEMSECDVCHAKTLWHIWPMLMTICDDYKNKNCWVQLS